MFCPSSRTDLLAWMGRVAESSTQTRPAGTTIERRTMIVWSTLVATMTLASGLLMWLEPQPLAPGGGLALAATGEGDRLGAVFATSRPIRDDRWGGIVIHHSGQMRGDARSIADLHDSLRYDGLQYHFVIGNGTGSADGLIEVGPRWMNQRDGVYAERSISICLVGNGDKTPPTAVQMDRLGALVRALRDQLSIPSERVVLHRQVAQTTSPGRLFPHGRFRDMLD